jgi:hypothetical protein
MKTVQPRRNPRFALYLIVNRMLIHVASARKRESHGEKRAAFSSAEMSSWAEAPRQTLFVVAKVLHIKYGRLWVSTPERRAFIETLTRPAYTTTKFQALMKGETIRINIYKARCVAVELHDHAKSEWRIHSSSSD